MRRELWAYAPGEKLTNDAADRGRLCRHPARRPAIRRSPTTPRSGTLFKLLDAEKATGIKLTESFAMWPAAAVSGLYFSHPESRYFGVGKIGRDQVAGLRRAQGLDHR